MMMLAIRAHATIKMRAHNPPLQLLRHPEGTFSVRKKWQHAWSDDYI